jgi:hypothetical protein
VKGASTRAKGASKVGFKPICYFLVQREYFIPPVATVVVCVGDSVV